MRLDLYLHRIRLVKSRTLAQSLIETGYVRLDGRRIEKTSEQVHEGSVAVDMLEVEGAATFPVDARRPLTAGRTYEFSQAATRGD